MPFPSFLSMKAALAGVGGAAALLGRRTKSKMRAKAGVRRKRGTKQQANSRIRPWPTNIYSIPPSMTTKLKASLVFTCTTATTAGIYGTERAFSMNSVQQPDITSDAVQPRYFDQFGALYERYRVTGATVRVRFSTADVTRILRCTARYANASNVTALSTRTTTDVSSMHNMNDLLISPAGEHSGELPPIYIDMKKLEGDLWFAKDNDYSAVIAGNPVAQPRMRISCANETDTTAVAILVTLEIVYHIKFYDRITPPASAP